MHLSLREWLIIIGIIIIVVILIDGFRRYRAAQKLSESDDMDSEALLKEAMIRRELPGGGARTVRSDDPVQNAFENAKSSVDARLTDLPHKVNIGPDFVKVDDMQLDELALLIPENDEEEVDANTDYSDPKVEEDEDDAFLEDGLESQYSSVDVSQVSPRGVTIEEEAEEEPKLDIEEVIVINVFAAEGKPFLGMELLQLVLNCGMRYGEMDIFHRYEDGFDKGKVQFSMANAVEPGTFDLDTMGEGLSSGVSFFMGLPGPKNSMKAFDYMLETAQALVRNLGGELRDERRSLMREQTIEHCRQRIRDFERRRLMRGKNS